MIPLVGQVLSAFTVSEVISSRVIDADGKMITFSLATQVTGTEKVI